MDRVESFPTDDETMANLASIKPNFVPEMTKEEEERMLCDQLKMWPIGEGEKDDSSSSSSSDSHQSKYNAQDAGTDPEVDPEFASTEVRRKVLGSLQEAAFQLDQLVTITKMLRKKEFMSLEACSRSLKNDDEEGQILSFVNSINQNAKNSSEAVQKRMDDAAEIIKSRRKFIRDCTMLQNLGWKMKRTKTHQFGIECSPGWSHELVQNSFYSLKNLKAGYVSFISYGHFHSSSYLKNWLQSNIHEYLHFPLSITITISGRMAVNWKMIMIMINFPVKC